LFNPESLTGQLERLLRPQYFFPSDVILQQVEKFIFAAFLSRPNAQDGRFTSAAGLGRTKV
jgi:hypothetical protein